MRLQYYVLRELVVALAFTLGGILVLALPAVAVVAVNKLPGVDIEFILRFIPLLLAGLVPYVVPLAFLLAVVATYGRLAADNEWGAAHMSGRNPLSLFVPGIVLSCVLGAFTLWMASAKLPEIRVKQSRYITEAVAQRFRHFAPGRTEIHLGEFYLSAASREGDDFIDAFMYLPSTGGDPAKTLLAERVHFEADETSVYARLHNARTVVGDQDVRLGEPTVRIDLEALQGKKDRNPGMRYMTDADLRAAMLDAGTSAEKRASFRYEIQYRRALASTCFLFMLLGAPTGLMLRRGTQLAALAVAVGYALAYYVLSMRLGKLLMENGVLAPGPAAWMVIVVGVVAGMLLTYRSMRR